MLDPSGNVLVRSANSADVPYIDSLQKRHTHQLGFLSRYALTEYVNRYHVSIGLLNSEPACYLLGRGPTLRHPGDARIYQACVQYDARFFQLGRTLVDHFVAALPSTAQALALWCAQDIEANYFWSALGFEAKAYRLGKKQKGRVHLLWVRSLVACGATIKFQIPETTGAGQMRKNRIVVPIPEGQHWSQVRASDDPDVLVTDWEEEAAPETKLVAVKRTPGKLAPRSARPALTDVKRVPMLTGGIVRMVPASLFAGRN